MSRSPSLRQLTDTMRAKHIPSAAIQDYAAHWGQLDPHGPTPCPLCYVGDDEQDGVLERQKEKNSRDSVKCDTCGAVIDLGSAARD